MPSLIAKRCVVEEVVVFHSVYPPPPPSPWLSLLNFWLSQHVTPLALILIPCIFWALEKTLMFWLCIDVLITHWRNMILFKVLYCYNKSKKLTSWWKSCNNFCYEYWNEYNLFLIATKNQASNIRTLPNI